jgi:hypothetical protein
VTSRLLVVIALAGCDRALDLPAPSTPDLSAPSTPDLSAPSTPDLSAPSTPDLAVRVVGDSGSSDLSRRAAPQSDLGGAICVGTRLEGTCVAQFFEPFVACFQPAGHCADYQHNSGDERCWEDGASFHLGRLANPDTRRYLMDGNVCLTSFFYLAPSSTQQFCMGGDPTCGPMQVANGAVPMGGGALYDSESGIFTCPDGTQVDVGADLGGCPLLNALLSTDSLCDGTIFSASCPYPF